MALWKHFQATTVPRAIEVVSDLGRTKHSLGSHGEGLVTVTD